MNTDLLRTFLEVSRTRHFGHAAENLYLTQSAVSARVKQLEEIIGGALFTRQRNNILLTSAGERLLPHAENLLASWQLAVQEVGVPRQQNMQIALGGTSNLWDVFLQSMLPSMAERFPSLYIRTEINQSQYLLRSLLGGRLDVAAMLDSPANVDIDSKRIGQLVLIMVCNEPSKTLEDVPQIGHVFVDWGTSFNLQQARLFSEPLAPILHTGQSHIALEFMRRYKGAGYLPRAIVGPHLSDGSLFEVKGADEICQDVYLAFKRGGDKSQQLGPMISWLASMDIEADDHDSTRPSN